MQRVMGLLALSVMVGCGGGPVMHNVDGIATFSDGSPLKKGVVSFSNESSTHRGSISTEGVFILENVLEGTYSVTITGVQEGGNADAEMNYDAEGNYIEPAESDEPKNLIAEKYSNPKESGISVTVPSDDYTIQVDRAE